jgi:hypothetical protein
MDCVPTGSVDQDVLAVPDGRCKLLTLIGVKPMTSKRSHSHQCMSDHPLYMSDHPLYGSPPSHLSPSPSICPVMHQTALVRVKLRRACEGRVKEV